MSQLADKAWDIFEGKKRGFVIAIPGVLLSSETVQHEVLEGKWRVWYERDSTGGVWEGHGDDLSTAYLDLIRARLEAR